VKVLQRQNVGIALTFFLLGEVLDVVTEAKHFVERDPSAERSGAREGGRALARSGRQQSRRAGAASDAIVPVDADLVPSVAINWVQVPNRDDAARVTGGVHALAQAAFRGGNDFVSVFFVIFVIIFYEI
jgi:hypothetical protein